MWYFILYLILAVWVLFDAKKRRNIFIGWSVGTFILGPLLIPFYFAKRHLKDNEIREGGTSWNVLKNFALFWTLTMFIAGIAGMVGAGEVVGTATTGAEQAGAVIGTGIGMMMLVMLWFIPMICALVLGFFLKKSSIIEKGQSGKLAAA